MKKVNPFQIPVLFLAVFVLLFSSCTKEQVTPEDTKSDSEPIQKIAELHSGWELLGPGELSSFDPEDVVLFLETLTINEVYEYTYNYVVANFFEENNIKSKDYFYNMSHKTIKGLPFQEMLNDAQWKELQERILTNDCDNANNVTTVFVWVYRGTWVRISVDNPFYKGY